MNRECIERGIYSHTDRQAHAVRLTSISHVTHTYTAHVRSRRTDNFRPPLNGPTALAAGHITNERAR